jgi:hypothetical protein
VFTPWTWARCPLEGNLAPLQSRLIAPPTPAQPIYDQGSHYGAHHSTHDESSDVHRTSPPNHNLRQRLREHLLTLWTGAWRPLDGNLARLAPGFGLRRLGRRSSAHTRAAGGFVNQRFTLTLPPPPGMGQPRASRAGFRSLPDGYEQIHRRTGGGLLSCSQAHYRRPSWGILTRSRQLDE